MPHERRRHKVHAVDQVVLELVQQRARKGAAEKGEPPGHRANHVQPARKNHPGEGAEEDGERNRVLAAERFP